MADIPGSAQGHPIVSINPGLRFTDERGYLTNRAAIALQQIRDYVVNINRIIPCNATGTNTITLTLLAIQPSVDKYNSYDTYAFVAPNTATSDLSALVVTENGTLDTLNVYKDNGATRASTGDTVVGLQYFLTYVDSLNSNAGGFVLR